MESRESLKLSSSSQPIVIFDDFETINRELKESTNKNGSTRPVVIFDDFEMINRERKKTAVPNYSSQPVVIFDDFKTSIQEESVNSITGDSGLKITFDEFPLASESKFSGYGNTERVVDSSLQKKPEQGLEEVTKPEDILETLPEIEEPSSRKKKCVELSFSMEKLRESLPSLLNTNSTSGSKLNFSARINPDENKTAEKELQRQISKSDFKDMTIFGQFNLGFIIVGLRDDLFIVDQHATDEKYNFETLQRTTVINSQKMVSPQSLELTAVNENVLMDNLDVFEKNGFKFDLDPSAPPTHRVKLTSLPISKNWTFGKEDIDELIFLLTEAGEGTVTRPSRVRAMFASRACRTSVMIGKALSKGKTRIQSIMRKRGGGIEFGNRIHKIDISTFSSLASSDFLKGQKIKIVFKFYFLFIIQDPLFPLLLHIFYFGKEICEN